MPHEDLRPNTITSRGRIQLEDIDEVLDRLSKARNIESAEKFQNQVVELEGEDPIVGFATGPDEEESRDVLSLGLETGDSDEEASLSITMAFDYENIDLFKKSFEEIAEKVIPDSKDLNINLFRMSFPVQSTFEELYAVQDLIEVSEYNMVGVRFNKGIYSYIFQEAENETVVLVNNTEEFIVQSSDFLVEQVEDATPFVKEICYGN